MLIALNRQRERISLPQQVRTARPILCRLFLLAYASLVANAQTLDALRREFVNPPKAMRPVVRWWWPGGDVEPDELRREVRGLGEAGVRGAGGPGFPVRLKNPNPAAVAAPGVP